MKAPIKTESSTIRATEAAKCQASSARALTAALESVDRNKVADNEAGAARSESRRSFLLLLLRETV